MHELCGGSTHGSSSLGGQQGKPLYNFQVCFSSRPVLDQTILSDFKKKRSEETLLMFPINGF